MYYELIFGKGSQAIIYVFLDQFLMKLQGPLGVCQHWITFWNFGLRWIDLFIYFQRSSERENRAREQPFMTCHLLVLTLGQFRDTSLSHAPVRL